jgi:hypothetical protein
MNYLKEGDVIELKEGHRIYFNLPEHFVYFNRVGVFDKMARTEITVGRLEKGMVTSFLEGKWIVTKTTLDGGGTGHGARDVYPNGHHVFIERESEEGHTMKADFYQSGAFTAMILPDEIEVVGKAKRNWIME